MERIVLVHLSDFDRPVPDRLRGILMPLPEPSPLGQE
jgi:hypothetical protein